MGIIFDNTKYNANKINEDVVFSNLEKRQDQGQGQYVDAGQSQGQQQPTYSGGGGNYQPIDLSKVDNAQEQVQEESWIDKPLEIVQSKYFYIGCGAFAGLVVLFLLLRYLIRHRKKPDLSKNFNRNYTKARDIIKHPEAESFSFDSRDDMSSGNLYRIESSDSMVKMFHSTDITYEKNNGVMSNNSTVNLSQVPKNVSPLTPAHLINQKSPPNELQNAHSLPNIPVPSSSSSISSQDSRTLINNRSRTFSSNNSSGGTGSLKPQRRSRTNSNRGKSNSTYYMSSDFVMTPFITKKIPGLEKNLPNEEEFVDYPPTPLPESLDDIPYSDNPDLDSEDTDGIVPPEEQIHKRQQSLPSSQSSPVSNKQVSPPSQPKIPVRKQSQATIQQSPPPPVRKQSQPMVQQSPPPPVRMQSQPMVQQSPPPVRMQTQPTVQQSPPPPVRMQSQPMVQQSPPPPVRMQSQTMGQQPPQPPAPIRMQSQPMVQQSPPATPARVTHPQQMMVNRMPPQPIQQVSPIQTRTPQQTPNRIPSQPMSQSPQRGPAYPNNQYSASPSQRQMGSNQASPSKQAFIPQTKSPKSPQPYRINQRGGPPKPQPRMSSRMEPSPQDDKQSNRKSVVSVHFEIPENKEMSFEEEMMASFEKFNNSYENLENVNTQNQRVAYTKQVI